MLPLNLLCRESELSIKEIYNLLSCAIHFDKNVPFNFSSGWVCFTE